LAEQTVLADQPPNIILSVPTIHCAACIGKIEKGLNALPNVSSARVNLSLKRVSIAASNQDASDMVAALSELGFAAHPLDADALGMTQDTTGRDLLLRMSIAGFAMMNVMLLSVAVWSGAAGATRDLFHLISAAISVPTVIYTAQPFFRSAWAAFRAKALNMDVPISLAIILATGLSLYETLEGGAHAYFDAALSLTFFLLIGRYLDHSTRAAAKSAAKELAALETVKATRIVAGNEVVTRVAELEIGNHIRIPTGARIPVDGVLLDETATTDRAFLTGETDAIKLSQNDPVQAGEINLAEPFDITATAVGQDTTLRRMAAMVELAENSRNSYTALADRASEIYVPVVHALAALAFVGWLIISGDVRYATNIAVAVLIITCPCALGLAVPAVSTAAIGKLYALGFLVKNGTALERIAETDTVVFDKTGTLTLPETPTGQPETLRPDAAAAAKTIQGKGYATHILSGDKSAKVDRIARMVGIENVVAEQTAEEKHSAVSQMSKDGRRVLMIGDGLNDTACLAAAHASLAPSSALDISRNAADVVLLRDSFKNLPMVLSVAKAASRLSRQNFAIAVAYNAVAIPIALLGYATPLIAALAMSLSSLTVLANAMRVKGVK
jgi:Cu2+-exporting ATPase